MYKLTREQKIENLLEALTARRKKVKILQEEIESIRSKIDRLKEKPTTGTSESNDSTTSGVLPKLDFRNQG